MHILVVWVNLHSFMFNFSSLCRPYIANFILWIQTQQNMLLAGWCWSCWEDAFCTARQEIWLWSKAGTKIFPFIFIFWGGGGRWIKLLPRLLYYLFPVETGMISNSLCWKLLQLRFAGDLLMELGAGVELATSVVPHLFLPLACAANVAKVH